MYFMLLYLGTIQYVTVIFYLSYCGYIYIYTHTPAYYNILDGFWTIFLILSTCSLIWVHQSEHQLLHKDHGQIAICLQETPFSIMV